MPQAILTQQIDWDISSGGGTQAITDVGSLSSAFVLPTWARMGAIGHSGTTSNANADDCMGAVALTATNTLTAYRSDTSAGTAVFGGCIVRYEGPASGEHEFIVRGRGSISFGTSDSSKSTAVSGIVNKNDCVVILTGVDGGATNVTQYDELTFVGELDASNNVVLTRTVTGTACDVYWQVVEFTGSEWSVGHFGLTNPTASQTLQNTTLNDAYDLGGSTFDVTDWATALILPATYRASATSANGLAETALPMCAPGSGTTQVGYAFGDGGASTSTDTEIRGYVIQNDALAMQTANDQLGGTSGSWGAGDNSFTITNTQSDLTLVALEYGAGTTGTGTAYNRGHCIARLTSQTNVDIYNHRSGNNRTWHIRAADLASLTYTSSLTVYPGSISSAETFETPTVTPGSVTINLTSIDSTETFENPTVTTTINRISFGVADARQVTPGSTGTLSVTLSSSATEWDISAFALTKLGETGSQTLLISSINSTEVFDNPTLTPGSTTRSVDSIVSTETFDNPTVTPGSVALSITSIDSEENFPNLTVTPGASTRLVDSINSAEAFGTPAITTGSVNIVPNSIDSTEAFENPTLSPGSVTRSLDSINSAEAFGTPAITTGSVTITITSIDSTEAFETPTVTPGAATIVPTSIGSTEAFESPTFNLVFTLTPNSIDSTETFETPTITPGSVTRSVDSINSTEAFETPTITPGSVTRSVDSINSTEAFETPTITVGSVTIVPNSIDSTETFENPTITLYVLPTSIGSTETFETPTILPQAVTVVPTSIASAESVNNIAAVDFVIYPGSANAGETFDNPTITTGSVTIVPTSIGSEEAFGSPNLNSGAIIIEDSGAIASTETFESITLTTGSVTRTVDSIASTETFDVPTITLFILPTSIESGETTTAVNITTSATIIPTAIDSTETFDAPTITIYVPINSISSLEAFENVTITTGSVDIIPTSINSAEVFGILSIGGTVTVPLDSIASVEAFENPTLTPGSVTRNVDSIASAENFSTDIIFQSGIWTITPVSIESAETFENPSLTTGSVSITLTSIGSAEVVNSITMLPGAITFYPNGISSEEWFSNLDILPGSITRNVDSINSTEAFGTPDITLGEAPQANILPTSIGSTEIFESIAVTPGSVTRSVDSIASTEIIGTINVSVGSVTINPTSIESTETFENPKTIIYVDVASISSTEIVNDISILFGQSITPNSIESGETFENIDISADSTTVLIDSISASEAFENDSQLNHLVYPFEIDTGSEVSNIDSTTIFIEVFSISENEFGNPTIQPGQSIIAITSGISSLESVNDINTFYVINASSISSEEAFGDIAQIDFTIYPNSLRGGGKVGGYVF